MLDGGPVRLPVRTHHLAEAFEDRAQHGPDKEDDHQGHQKFKNYAEHVAGANAPNPILANRGGPARLFFLVGGFSRGVNPSLGVLNRDQSRGDIDA